MGRKSCVKCLCVIFIRHPCYCGLLPIPCLIVGLRCLSFNQQTEGTGKTQFLCYCLSLKWPQLFILGQQRECLQTVWLWEYVLYEEKNHFKAALIQRDENTISKLHHKSNLLKKIRFNIDNSKCTVQKCELTFVRQWQTKVIFHDFSFVVNIPLC